MTLQTPNRKTKLYNAAEGNVQGIFGHTEGYGTDPTNKCLLGTLTGTTPLNVTGLKESALYEFMAMDQGDLIDGAPDHLWFKPGGTAASPADPGTSMPWRCFTDDQPLQVKLPLGVTTISFVAANTGKTIRVYGRFLE